MQRIEYCVDGKWIEYTNRETLWAAKAAIRRLEKQYPDCEWRHRPVDVPASALRRCSEGHPLERSEWPDDFEAIHAGS